MRLTREFYQQEVPTIAHLLLGKQLVRQLDDGTQLRLTINEVEAYRGEEDLAHLQVRINNSTTVFQ